ncbi:MULTISPECIES: HutD family protein [Sphingomonas]|uniref:HutD/Ves family protein n=1 Tax=Sphingomonas TaxID=13687 RepID=UPI002238B930|nr:MULTISPECIES: HutD family protein [Sphingomonas]MCW6528904.1 HutD family protein [Sphingomonas lycopersici]
MIEAQFLPAAQRAATPWKNGGGSTAEVVAFPPGADFTSFLWRLSIAEVATAGPFSHFAGIDRTLAVISGELALTIDGAAPVTLDARSAPLPFAGEAPVVGTPLGGAVMDLNAMVRRGDYAAEMRGLSGDEMLESAGDTLVVVALGPLTLSHGGETRQLERLDAFACATGAIRIDAPGAARCGLAVRFIRQKEEPGARTSG